MYYEYVVNFVVTRLRAMKDIITINEYDLVDNEMGEFCKYIVSDFVTNLPYNLTMYDIYQILNYEELDKNIPSTFIEFVTKIDELAWAEPQDYDM